MNNPAKILVSLIIIFLVSCTTEKEFELGQFNTPKSWRVYSSSDLPDVTIKVADKFSLNSERKKFAVNSEYAQEYFEIDWNRIYQQVDSLGHETYAFLLNDSDEDPYTFYNLIYKKAYDEKDESFFIMKYQMDESFIPEYKETNSLLNFRGIISKMAIKEGSYSDKVAGINAPRSIATEECPDSSIDNSDSPTAPSGGGGSTTSSTTYYVATTKTCRITIWEQKYDNYVGGAYAYSDYIITGITVDCWETSEIIRNQIEAPDCELNEDDIPMIDPNRSKKITLLETLLEQDSTLLINLPCSEMSKWKNVGEFKPSQSVVNKIKELDENSTRFFTGDFDIQTLEEAKGKVVNMDFFAVDINSLPNGYTAESFLNQIRLNFNSFINTDYSSFHPYDFVDTGSNEEQIWNSGNPLGAIIHIEIPIDEGSVICSDYDASQWKFTTISAPYDWVHPVSGTREFGFYENANGKYTFYTRGVDRITQNFNEILGARATFNGADNLWKSFQDGIMNFVNSNGGSAIKLDPVIGRPDWDLVEAFINGEVTVDQLGCSN